MNAVEIVTALLKADLAIAELVESSRIKAGALPQNVTLPALLAREISQVERLKLVRVGKVLVTSRIEVAVRAKSYREQKAVLALVIHACAGRTGDIGGGTSVAITSAGAGPDLVDEAGIFQQAQDFRVTHEIDA